MGTASRKQVPEQLHFCQCDTKIALTVSPSLCLPFTLPLPYCFPYSLPLSYCLLSTSALLSPLLSVSPVLCFLYSLPLRYCLPFSLPPLLSAFAPALPLCLPSCLHLPFSTSLPLSFFLFFLPFTSFSLSLQELESDRILILS